MKNRACSQFFNAWWVWYLCSMKMICIMLVNAFSMILKRLYFYQTEVPFLNKTWSPFLCFYSSWEGARVEVLPVRLKETQHGIWFLYKPGQPSCETPFLTFCSPEHEYFKAAIHFIRGSVEWFDLVEYVIVSRNYF